MKKLLASTMAALSFIAVVGTAQAQEHPDNQAYMRLAAGTVLHVVNCASDTDTGIVKLRTLNGKNVCVLVDTKAAEAAEVTE